MVWIKRNLYFLIGSVVALALMGVGGYYLWTQMSQESQITEDITKKYSELNDFNKAKLQPGTPDKIDNVKAAREQEAALRAYVQKARGYFQAITPIPDSPKVANDEFARELAITVTQLHHAAEQQSIVLPNNDYYFTFEAQKKLMIFEPASLNRLAAHLGEIKAICDILFDAKINQLDNIRRELVSANDDNPNDYLLQPKLSTVSEPLADLVPYQVTFRCFSPELARVLGALAASPDALTIKTVNIEPATATGEIQPNVPVTAQPAPPVYNRYNTGAGNYPGYGGRRGGLQQFYQPLPVPGAAPVKTGPTVFLDEKPLRVTLLIYVIRLKPAK